MKTVITSIATCCLVLWTGCKDDDKAATKPSTDGEPATAPIGNVAAPSPAERCEAFRDRVFACSQDDGFLTALLGDLSSAPADRLDDWRSISDFGPILCEPWLEGLVPEGAIASLLDLDPAIPCDKLGSEVKGVGTITLGRTEMCVELVETFRACAAEGEPIMPKWDAAIPKRLRKPGKEVELCELWAAAYDDQPGISDDPYAQRRWIRSARQGCDVLKAAWDGRPLPYDPPHNH